MTTRQELDPLVVRAQVIEGDHTVSRQLWAGRGPDGSVVPVRVTVDHITSPIRGEVTGYQITLSSVRHPGLAKAIADACPRGGLLDLTGGRSLALDCWIPELDERVVQHGYTVQHWSIPRLVLSLTQRGEDPLAILSEPSTVPDAFASGLAIEAPERAGLHDLWWPRSVGGTDVPAPVRAYQYVREASVPPVPV